jgi:type II secretory pathway component GspD/PulD (secretin)
MVKTLCFVAALSLAVLGFASAQSASPSLSDTPVTMAFPYSELTDVLKFYAQLSGRKVWVQLGVTGKVSVETHRPVPRAEALSLLRGSLLAAGFDIREVGESEAFVSRASPPR